jgi:hypothetical protein
MKCMEPKPKSLSSRQKQIKLFTMTKSIVKYPKAGGTSKTGKPSGGKRTTIVPATPPDKK